MKKNKKIYIITGLFFIIIFGLFFISNNKASALDWKYYFEKAESVGSITRIKVPFETEEECLRYLSQVNVNLNPSSTCSVWEEVVDLNSQVNIEHKNVYTLLAPIGDQKEIKTNDIGKYFNILFNLAIGIAGALAVIMLVIGGIQWMGSESVFGKSAGKEQMTAALLGLFIALGSYALLNTINPDLLGGKGLSIDPASVRLEKPILSDAGKTIPTGAKNSFSDCLGGVKDVEIKTNKTQNFIFCSAYGEKLQSMFSDAYNSTPKIILSGGGFRTYEEQLQARKDNKCPNILTSPANKCKPPTAKPGESLHEQGLAVDLKCDGVLINWDDQNPTQTKTLATKKCFDWLEKNAKNYGFENFKKENWHWSTGPRAGS